MITMTWETIDLSYNVCKSVTRFCCHRSRTGNKCFDYYKLYCFRDSIKICLSDQAERTRYSGHAQFFNYVEAQNFFQTCRKINKDVNEMDYTFYGSSSKLLSYWWPAFIYDSLLHKLGIALLILSLSVRGTIGNIFLMTSKGS